jgi:hypothetical protein
VIDKGILILEKAILIPRANSGHLSVYLPIFIPVQVSSLRENKDGEKRKISGFGENTKLNLVFSPIYQP